MSKFSFMKGKNNLSLCGYDVMYSGSETEIVEDYKLVKDDQITVSADGQVLFENLRAFAPVKKNCLIREQNGIWFLCTSKGKKIKLVKVNLIIEKNKKAMMFDERGKMHLSQISTYYKDLSV